jgi:hypothetical protein
MLSKAAFIEIQVHDKMKDNLEKIKQLSIAEDFKGFVTIHGEGETDGRKRILFSSQLNARTDYVKQCAQLYSKVIKHLYPITVKRIIAHPSSLDRNGSRRDQIYALSESLVALQDLIDSAEICIEPRGCDRHRKVLRVEISDIEMLDEFLHKLGGDKIGLCIDIAQLFLCKGNEGIVNFFSGLKKDVKEFHISDVTERRLGVEIGKGLIDWGNIIPHMLDHCKDFLVETLGGIRVFNRSLEYLERRVHVSGQILL